MNTDKERLTSEQKEFVRAVLRDPVAFATRFLGAALWAGEVEILRSIQKNRRTAIKACHGAGKTYSLALAALWWLARYPQGIVLTTSPTLRQVKTQLWAEIRRIASSSRVPYPKVNTAELTLRGSDNYALGLSTDSATNIQGYHGKQVLIIVDEAPGIAAELWDAIAGMMAGGKVHLVIAGNPTTPSGSFYDAFYRERGLWNCITIDAFDSPNLKGLTLKELLQLDPSDGGPLDNNSFPYLVTKRWVYDQYIAWWHGDERSSPSWVSRVRGEFPDQSQNALVKLAWLERAKHRAFENLVQDTGGRLIAGVDVGGVDSETVVYLCEVGDKQGKILKFGAWRGEDTRGHVVAFLAPYRDRLIVVRVDADGVGHNFGLHLRDQRLPVELAHVGRPVESTGHPEDPALRFVNQKAQMYQQISDLLEREQLDGLSDDTTIGQLAGIIYEIDPLGRMMIESKEKSRARGVLSPDRAEALMLALGKPHQRFEYYSVRDLPRLRSRTMDDDVDDADRPNRSTNWGPFVGKLRFRNSGGF